MLDQHVGEAFEGTRDRAGSYASGPPNRGLSPCRPLGSLPAAGDDKADPRRGGKGSGREDGIETNPGAGRCRWAGRYATRSYSGRASNHRAARSGSPPCPRFSRNVAAFLAPNFSARAHAMNGLSETPSCRAWSSAAFLSDLGRFNETRAS